MSNLIWWTGLGVWISLAAGAATFVLLLIRDAWRAAVFTRRLWRAEVRAGRKPQWRRLPASWWESLTPCDHAIVPGAGYVSYPGREPKL